HYETATVEPQSLTVVGAPVAASAAQPAPAAAAAVSAPEPPPLPAPLGGPARALAPLPAPVRAAWLAAPFALLVLVGLGRAAVRAWQAHPARAARRRRRALLSAIVAVERASDATARAAAVLAWQHAAARALGLACAAPTSAQLRAEHGPRWAALWAASERALYARDGQLPPEWCAAARALAAPPAPSVTPAAAPRRRWRLLPRAATAAL